jgi:hypothetical protein
MTILDDDNLEEGLDGNDEDDGDNLQEGGDGNDEDDGDNEFLVQSII